MKATQGASDNQAADIARNFGITQEGINQIYNQYGNHPLAKTILGFMNTSPEKLKNDATSILNQSVNPTLKDIQSPNKKTSIKFPRLK